VKRPTLGGTLRALVAIGLTVVVFWKSRPSEVMSAAAHADWRPIGGAALLVLLDRALMAYRWVVLLRPFSGPGGPTLRVVMRIFFISTFVGTFLPSSVGGDAVRAYALSKHGVPAAGAIASVLMDRMLGVLSLLIMAMLGLFLVQHLASDPLVLTALGLTTTVCAVAAMLVFSTRAETLGRWLCNRIRWARARGVGVRLIEAMQRYATRRGDLLNVLGGSLGVQVLRIIQAY
jgi:uncharacterized protein (TIRG00374 family)